MRTLDPAHVEWCRRHFSMLRDGAMWAVPRSGMIFQRRGDQLVLTAEMPWTSAMAGVVTQAELREQQDEEFQTIRDHFAAAGIEVVRLVHRIDCDMGEDCTCGYDMNDPADREDAWRQLEDEA